MHFAVAGIDVAPWIPPVAAFVISFFTSMGGVSGAFLLMPFQMSVLGYTSPSVSATNQLFNIVAIPSGVYRYYKEGRMVWPLTWAVILGTLPGVLLGAVIRIHYLPDAKNFKIFAGMVLGYIGLRMVMNMRTQKATPAPQTLRTETPLPDSTVRIQECSIRCISFDFSGQTYSTSTLRIMVMSLVVGVVGGIYGIGGGSIVAPFFVSVCGLPVYTVAGASLMGTLVTSVVGVGVYEVLAVLSPDQSIAPDYGLGMLLGAGGMAGMYCGARLQKFIPASYIKAMLCLIILGTALSYIAPVFY